MAVKNFWSLNIDEAIVSDKLQDEFNKKRRIEDIENYEKAILGKKFII